MLCGLRLDAPGVLHHVMVRGLERRAIFRDDGDRADCVPRLAAFASGALAISAWALLPNYAHLLVRTGVRPLARSLRSLLTGYAGAFNRRHRRGGHLFQNRDTSLVVEAEPYLRDLARYLHRNPLRAGVVRDLAALDTHPWTGQSGLLGRRQRPWQAVDEALGPFAKTRGLARPGLHRDRSGAGPAAGPAGRGPAPERRRRGRGGRPAPGARGLQGG
jgi:REP element-mobilizing transposase RayT